MKKILVTGPESSGKSFIVKALVNKFSAGIVEEYARKYLEDNRSYNQEDLTEIAIKQFDSELRESHSNHELLICDTGIEVLKIWSLKKYDSISPVLISLQKQSNYDLILICKPNIPWVYDRLRENEYDRDMLFDIYLNEFITQIDKVEIVDEELSSRVSQSINFVSNLLNESG